MAVRKELHCLALGETLLKTQFGMETMKVKTLGNVICSAVFLAASLWGQTVTQSPASSSQDPNTQTMETLKAILAAQQKQIDQLKLALEDQKKLIERVANLSLEWFQITKRIGNRDLASSPDRCTHRITSTDW